MRSLFRAPSISTAIGIVCLTAAVAVAQPTAQPLAGQPDVGPAWAPPAGATGQVARQANPWSGYLRPESAIRQTRRTDRTDHWAEVPVDTEPAIEPDWGDDAEPVIESDWVGGDCLCHLPSACGPIWFGGVYALGMTRDDDRSVWLSFDTANPTGHLLGSRDADMNWQAGSEIRFGRILSESPWALEVAFWGVYAHTSEVNVMPSPFGGLNTAIDFGALIGDGSGLGGGAFVSDFYNGAARHRLRRSYEYQNIELNLLRFPFYGTASACDYRPGLHLRGLVGVRLLRADQHFQFAGDAADTTFGSDNDEMAYDIDVKNHLIGVQIGGRADYILFRRWNVYTDAKLGLYGNHISHHSRIGNDLGAAVVGPAAAGNIGRAFDVRSTKDEVSLLGELAVGVTYQISPHWQLTGGYRAVAMTGVAQPTDQIPHVLTDIDGVASINSSGSAILHGFLAGMQLSF